MTKYIIEMKVNWCYVKESNQSSNKSKILVSILNLENNLSTILNEK